MEKTVQSWTYNLCVTEDYHLAKSILEIFWTQLINEEENDSDVWSARHFPYFAKKYNVL